VHQTAPPAAAFAASAVPNWGRTTAPASMPNRRRRKPRRVQAANGVMTRIVLFPAGLPGRFEVCYEASCGYSHYHDVLRPLAARVVVAHPGQLRLIVRSKTKNDRIDVAPGQAPVPGR